MSAAEMDANRKAALATLTDEERAAIDSDDMTDAEHEALKAVAGEPDDDEDGNDDGGGDDYDEGGAAPAKGKAAAPVATDEQLAAIAAAEDVQDEEATPAFKPRYHVDLPEDLDEQLATISAAEEALVQKMKDGEIEVADFILEQKRLTKEAAKLEGQRDKAADFEELNRQNAEQEWKFTVNQFFRKTKKADGIDYQTDTEKGRDFDSFVKALAAREENADKDYDWFLSEAHKRVKALHGVAEKKAEDPKPKPGDKPAPRKAPTAGMPATLALVPGGEGPGDMGDEFADIDALDGLEYETALAKMTPAQRERYMQAA